MADAADSKSVARKGVWVQVPPPAFENKVFLILRIRAAPEDKVANPFRTHNLGRGQRTWLGGGLG
jgi:hypothetical protein